MDRLQKFKTGELGDSFSFFSPRRFERTRGFSAVSTKKTEQTIQLSTRFVHSEFYVSFVLPDHEENNDAPGHAHAAFQKNIRCSAGLRQAQIASVQRSDFEVPANQTDAGPSKNELENIRTSEHKDTYKNTTGM